MFSSTMSHTNTSPSLCSPFEGQQNLGKSSEEIMKNSQAQREIILTQLQKAIDRNERDMREKQAFCTESGEKRRVDASAQIDEDLKKNLHLMEANYMQYKIRLQQEVSQKHRSGRQAKLELGQRQMNMESMREAMELERIFAEQNARFVTKYYGS